ncbi:biotin transporter BioY [Patulibacter sp. NPDC049589]|uniref:biotin transporter BioY n=1 Tax=Patulibacter sp. NPDC049589 TaxID=3154731 RepID=UPI0034326431
MSSITSPGVVVRPRTVLADVLPGARVRDAVLVLFGALFTGLMAQITIPMTPVPMTGQTLAVGLVGATLGLRRGTSSMLLYIVLGFALPVYADGGSGVEALWGSSGGYLVGFVLATALIGFLAERGADKKIHLAFAAFVLGQLLVFVPGVLVLQAVTHMSWGDAVHYGFTVFIVGGLVKAAVGGALLPAAWKAVRRYEG